ncbi:MAG: 50S ribosomal protein L10 [Dehalococcoidia bacterium]
MVKKEKKSALVDEMTDKLSRSSIVIATDYRGLTVSEITALRRKLREQGAEYQVVKNTLAKRAAASSGKEHIYELFTGPTALVFGYEDPVQPARALSEYQRTMDEAPLDIKGGMLENRILTPQEVAGLATLPPKNELIAKFVGLTQSPIAKLLTVLNGNIQGLARVLQGRLNQLEQQGG